MTLPTHLIAGLIIGKLTGNYSLALASSVLPDIDHLPSYIKSGIILKPKLFWKTVTSQKDSFGNQRGYLHNFLIFVIISTILFLVLNILAIPLILGWLGHLLLESLDNSDYWPLYPNKSINIKGPIKYGTKDELVLFTILIITYFLI